MSRARMAAADAQTYSGATSLKSKRMIFLEIAMLSWRGIAVSGAQHPIDAVLGIAKQHARVFLIKRRIKATAVINPLNSITSD